MTDDEAVAEPVVDEAHIADTDVTVDEQVRILLTRAMNHTAMPKSLAEWLQHLETLHPVGIDLGLERVSRVAERRAIQTPIANRVVIVAGTNGKGSTVAMVDAVARAHGWHVGTYSSPHLLRYNERVRINGQEAGDACLVEGFERVEQARLECCKLA